jgi:hypothetical protein
MKVKIFGDSHVKFLFKNTKNTKLNWLGPITMYRVGRDAAWFLKEGDNGEGKWGIFVFGEIDVRCHIEKQALFQKVSIDQLISNITKKYLVGIEGSSRFSNYIILGCPPPSDGPGLENKESPVFGKISTRVEIRKSLDYELANHCKIKGFYFSPFPDFYETKDGILDPRMSDGSVHIQSEMAWPVIILDHQP